MVIKNQLRETAKFIVRQTAGRLPASASRFTGKLALDGGTPVRNVRLRPWRKLRGNSWGAWRTGAGATLRSVFLSGIEGLPQPLATKFANQWALYCGCRFGLLLPHGTDALRIGLAAALDHDGLDYGGEIIMPNLAHC
jgi:hypothetical protein